MAILAFEVELVGEPTYTVPTRTTLATLCADSSLTTAEVESKVGAEARLFERVDQGRQALPARFIPVIAAVLAIDRAVVRAACRSIVDSIDATVNRPHPPRFDDSRSAMRVVPTVPSP